MNVNISILECGRYESWGFW